MSSFQKSQKVKLVDPKFLISEIYLKPAGKTQESLINDYIVTVKQDYPKHFNGIMFLNDSNLLAARVLFVYRQYSFIWNKIMQERYLDPKDRTYDLKQSDFIFFNKYEVYNETCLLFEFSVHHNNHIPDILINFFNNHPDHYEKEPPYVSFFTMHVDIVEDTRNLASKMILDIFKQNRINSDSSDYKFYFNHKENYSEYMKYRIAKVSNFYLVNGIIVGNNDSFYDEMDDECEIEYEEDRDIIVEIEEQSYEDIEDSDEESSEHSSDENSIPVILTRYI